MTAVGASLNSHVLVLNKHRMAVRVTDAKRAFSLLVRDLAEVIHCEDDAYTAHTFESWSELSMQREMFEKNAKGVPYDWVRTVRFSVAVPKVIRLLGYDRLPEQDVKLNRRNIYARDKSICQYCGIHFPSSELSLDHVVPRSQNGKSTWENLVCCCVKCNAHKGGRTPEQASMKLIKKPVKPKRNPMINIRMGSEKYASWRAFLNHAYWSVELK